MEFRSQRDEWDTRYLLRRKDLCCSEKADWWDDVFEPGVLCFSGLCLPYNFQN